MKRILFALAAICVVSCSIELAVSGTATQMMNGTSNYQLASLVANTSSFAYLTDKDSAAQWVWITPTPVTPPPFGVSIREFFTILCPDEPVSITIAVPAGVSFHFQINGNTGAGVGPRSYIFQINTTGVSCGENMVFLLFVNWFSGPYPGVYFHQNTEHCANTNCQCPNCSKSIPGCLTCICDTFCSSCDIRNFFKYDPVKGKCVCIDGYYLDPNGKCVPCPKNMYCKTCTFNRMRYRVECTTCPCQQKRILYPYSMYCGCANGSECCNFTMISNDYQLPANYSVSPCCL